MTRITLLIHSMPCWQADACYAQDDHVGAIAPLDEALQLTDRHPMILRALGTQLFWPAAIPGRARFSRNSPMHNPKMWRTAFTTPLPPITMEMPTPVRRLQSFGLDPLMPMHFPTAD